MTAGRFSREEIASNMPTLSAYDFGEIIGVSARRVQQLSAEGVIPKTDKGRYNLADGVRAYCTYLKVSMGTVSERDVKSSHEAEKTKLTSISVEREGLKLAVMKGELHKAEDVRYILTDMIVAAKTKLLGIPTRVAPELLNENNIAKIQALLADKIEEALTELAEYRPEMFSNSDMLDVEGGEEVVAEE